MPVLLLFKRGNTLFGCGDKRFGILEVTLFRRFRYEKCVYLLAAFGDRGFRIVALNVISCAQSIHFAYLFFKRGDLRRQIVIFAGSIVLFAPELLKILAELSDKTRGNAPLCLYFLTLGADHRLNDLYLFLEHFTLGTKLFKLYGSL